MNGSIQNDSQISSIVNKKMHVSHIKDLDHSLVHRLCPTCQQEPIGFHACSAQISIRSYNLTHHNHLPNTQAAREQIKMNEEFLKMLKFNEEQTVFKVTNHLKR